MIQAFEFEVFGAGTRLPSDKEGFSRSVTLRVTDVR